MDRPVPTPTEAIIRSPLGEVRVLIDADGKVRTSLRIDYAEGGGVGAAARAMAQVSDAATDAVRALVGRMGAQSDGSLVADWLEERCVRATAACETERDLYTDFRGWLAAQRVEPPIPEADFHRSLSARKVGTIVRRSDGQIYRYSVHLKRGGGGLASGGEAAS
jgi:hypothetical protein